MFFPPDRYFSGSLLETMSPQSVFGLTALFPLLAAGFALRLDEEPAQPVQARDVLAAGAASPRYAARKRRGGGRETSVQRTMQ